MGSVEDEFATSAAERIAENTASVPAPSSEASPLAQTVKSLL